MKRIIIVVFVLVALVQLSVPAWMIGKREWTLKHGDVYHFKTQPVDPYDAFRGRYVTLSFEASRMTNAVFSDIRRKQTVYASVAVDEAGFAHLDDLSHEKTEDTFLPVKMQWSGNNQTTVRMPFDRFYMEETLAKTAERLYWQHTRRDATSTYAVVRVADGFAVVEDLIVNGRPIVEYAREQAKELDLK